MDLSFIDTLRQAVPAAAIEPGEARDMPTVYVDADHLLDVCRTLRDHADLQFAFLVEVTAVDLLPAEPRYCIVYHMACLGPAFGSAPARRLRLKVRVAGHDPHVPTVTSVWPGRWMARARSVRSVWDSI